MASEDPKSSPSGSAGATKSTTLLNRLVREHVRPHLGRLLTAALLMAVVAAATAASAWLLKPAIDKVFIEQSKSMLILIPLAVLGVTVIKALAAYGQNVLMNNVGQKIIADTQVEMFDHLIHADLSWLHDTHTGALVSSFLYDVTLLRDAVSRAITGLAKDSLSIVFLAGVMFYQDAKLALVTLFVFPLAGIAMRKLGRRMRKASTAAQEDTGLLSKALSEAFRGGRLVKAHGMEDWETARAAALVDRRLKHLMKAVRTRAAATPITEAVGGVAIGAAIFYGGLEARSGNLTVGEFMSFIGAMLMAYQPLKSLANTNTALQEGLAAAERVFRLMDVKPKVTDRPGAGTLDVVAGRIDFENVAFSYGDGVPTIENISFSIAPGTKVALVGPSGAGKSTVLNLLPRFFDVTGGKVLIDGQDVRDVTVSSLRAKIGLVSQETTLFDTTVRSNIAYGRSDASEDDIIAAAKNAAADEFIRALPRGYDTIVGEGGIKLSGGQRQRIAIARAMLKNAPILLLDEATSALDADSEQQVQVALHRLMAGRTTVIVAHRLSTVLDADDIYVLDKGRVVERGAHHDLIGKGAVYAKLYALQSANQPAVSVLGETALSHAE